MRENGSPVPPGSRPLHILHVCSGQDTGGQAIASKLAFAAVDPAVKVKVVTASQSYIGYPLDPDLSNYAGARGNWNWTAIQELYGAADLVVLHRDAVMYPRFDHGQRKPIVIHHHGTHFRRNPEVVWASGAAVGAVQCVSTVDLLDCVPKGQTAHWLPQIVDVERLAVIRRVNYKRSKTIRIAHAPTDRLIKGTRYVEAVIRELAKKYPVQAVIIERVSWERCLARKATADIYVDQFQLGYGNNTLEAWALGMPVVCGADKPILARMRKEYHRKTRPFYEATPETLYARLEELILSESLRAEWAARGMAHIKRFHSQAAVVARLNAIYASVPPSVGGPTAADKAAAVAEARAEQIRTRALPVAERIAKQAVVETERTRSRLHGITLRRHERIARHQQAVADRAAQHQTRVA